MKAVKKGINQWCYPPETTLDDVLKWTKAAGFEAIELNVSQPGGIGLTMETSPAEAKQIKQAIAAHGLETDSLSTALLWEFPLSSADRAIQEEGKRIVRKMLELASAIEASTILVVPGVVTKETPYDVCYQNSISALRSLLPYAEELGVAIGIENVWNRFLLSPLEMKTYIDSLQSEYVGAYFDVGNVLPFGYPEQWIRILGKRILKVHVKDFKETIGNINGFTNLLAGDVDFKSVIAELKAIGYNGEVTAELTPYKEHPFALAYDTARQLDVLLGRHSLVSL
ncbi:sugar phosphate isomerase/epimerase family protein [Shouchella clausii]|uniref:sugar phosphate isomerase/epimerase family protein n=1 Tax=Shouchella clausii TaxID=79880 RepID=UPI002ACD57D4|nr:sugar phosphate isomerase/epimerase family protein [Shouchella clausii]WQG94436.1 sugar phosphate isomerase/epimerase family protein [Shouchella clausii]